MCTLTGAKQQWTLFAQYSSITRLQEQISIDGNLDTIKMQMDFLSTPSYLSIQMKF